MATELRMAGGAVVGTRASFAITNKALLRDRALSELGNGTQWRSYVETHSAVYLQVEQVNNRSLVPFFSSCSCCWTRAADDVFTKENDDSIFLPLYLLLFDLDECPRRCRVDHQDGTICRPTDNDNVSPPPSIHKVSLSLCA